MQSKNPDIGDAQARKLAALGARIRANRKQLKVNATTTAEAAGLSRPTLYRIERGEPSVTMGAYLAVIAALGLDLQLSDPQADKTGADVEVNLPLTIRLTDYPELKRLAWQIHAVDELTPLEALHIYERNWRHVDAATLAPHERALVQQLAARLGGGRLLV